MHAGTEAVARLAEATGELARLGAYPADLQEAAAGQGLARWRDSALRSSRRRAWPREPASPRLGCRRDLPASQAMPPPRAALLEASSGTSRAPGSSRSRSSRSPRSSRAPGSPGSVIAARLEAASRIGTRRGLAARRRGCAISAGRDCARSRCGRPLECSHEQRLAARAARAVSLRATDEGSAKLVASERWTSW